MKKFVIVLSLFLFPSFSEARFASFGSLSLGGSQSFFKERHSGFGGFANLRYVPAFSLSDRSSFIPRFQFNYQGTLSAVRVIDEGSLFQQRMTALAALKYVRKITRRSKLKAELTGKYALLKEVKNETWGEGLYDYQYLGLGGEWERRGRRTKHRLGAVFSIFRYPNYKALSSAIGLELMGTRTLDTDNVLVYYAVDFRGRRQVFKLRLNLEAYSYLDQNLVQPAGDFSSSKRLDEVSTIRLGYMRYLKFSRRGSSPVLGLDFYSRTRLSNQNHYDAEQFKFIDNFYDYATVGISPSFAGRIPSTSLTVRLSYDVSLRCYIDRLIQDEVTGAYQDEKLSQVLHLVNLRMNFPLTRLMDGLSTEMTASLSKSVSNMKYERFYNYNYTSFSYILGLRYDF